MHIHIYVYIMYLSSRDIVNCFCRHNFEVGGHLGIAVALEVTKKEAKLDKFLERLGLHKNRTTYFKRKQKASSAIVAGVGQMALGGVLGLVWARLGRAWRRGILRGRRGTNLQLLSFCVAGVAQTHIYRRFAWQAWDRWHWVACLVWFGRALVTRDAAAFCVAGVALGDIHFGFAWQAWHKLKSTVVLRGRRGTDGTGWRAWSAWHTYIHTYLRTYVRTYIHTYLRTYVHTYIRTYVRTYIHTYIPTILHT